MTKITVVDFKQEHLNQIELKQCHQDEVPKLVMTAAITLMYEEKPLAIFGAFHFIDGVFHIWAFVSENVSKCPIDFYKTTIGLIRFYKSGWNARRLQIDIRDGYPELARWAESIGFQREGLMKNFGSDGSDYWLFGRAS